MMISALQASSDQPKIFDTTCFKKYYHKVNMSENST